VKSDGINNNMLFLCALCPSESDVGNVVLFW